MNDTDQIQVQNSVNLSLALIAVAVAVIAGVVAALFSVAEHIPVGGKGAIIGSLAFFTFVLLTASIALGGKGIQATNRSVRLITPTAPLVDKYDDGNFSKQVMCGILGLFIGLLILPMLTWYFWTRADNHTQTEPSIEEELVSEIRKTREQIQSLWEIMHKASGDQEKSRTQTVRVEIPGLDDVINMMKARQTNSPNAQNSPSPSPPEGRTNVPAQQ